MSSARSVLDRVQSLAAIEALEADPGQYATQLAIPAATTLAELEARDALLAGALREVDEVIARVMRIRLDHALASDTSIAAPTRRVFASTVASYATSLPLLAERVRDIAARGRAADPDAIAEAVVAAARTSLLLRDAVRAGVLFAIRELATAAIPAADQRARDRDLDDVQRKRWSAVRRDLEAIADEPERILAAPFATRIAAWPEQLDEPAPKPEPTLAELIELD